jgi:cathepsin B
MLKVLSACAVMATALGSNEYTDQRIVDKINAQPNVLWTAGINKRFEGQSLKSMTGVTAESWGAVQKLPRHKSTIRDEDIPTAFDSEANWPQCAKVIGDIRDQSMCGCCWCVKCVEEELCWIWKLCGFVVCCCVMWLQSPPWRVGHG